MGTANHNKQCRSCGCGLNVHQRIRGLCDQPECRRKDVAYQAQLRRQATHTCIRNSLPPTWDSSAPIALLPRNSKPLVPLAGTRIEALRAHLMQITREAKETPTATPIKDTTASTNGIAPEQSGMPALAAACGVCGGYCCNTGGDSAWLEPATLRRLQWHTLEISDARIVEYYLSFLPDHSYENSCIFHAVDGCRLPREIRSNVCNQYFCGGLAELASGLSQEKRLCVAAALIGNTPKEIAKMDAIGVLEKFTPE